MSKVTEQDFDEYINDLDADDILDLIKDYDKYELLKYAARDTTIDAERERFKEKECYQCDDCRDYFTDADDLNEDDKCSDCAYEETTAEKVRTEVNESEGEING